MVALHGAEPAIHQAAREGGEDGFGHCLFGDARGERGDTNLHQGPADDLVHAINPLPADAWTSLLTQRSPPLTGGSTSPLLRRAMPTVTPWARAPRWRRPSRRPTASRTSTAGRPLRVAPLARASSGQPSSLVMRTRTTTKPHAVLADITDPKTHILTMRPSRQGAGRGRRPGAGGALRGGHGAGEAPRGGYRAQGFDGGGER
mmetsp:Transcript_28198/g.90147  ORF Transcript_28198/g.90147 Transcript_28198/m.90147 type:complete len:203 (-) Transcript_28198:1031-1639(-)